MTRRICRCASLLSAAALALGASACGDSDDNGSNQNAASDHATPAAASNPQDEKAAAAVMPALTRSFNNTDGKAYCSKRTTDGKREIQQYSLEIQKLKGTTCEQFMSSVSATVVKSGNTQKPVRVREVKLAGDKATVTISGGPLAPNATANYKLHKDNGTWKVTNPISGAQTTTTPNTKK